MCHLAQDWKKNTYEKLCRFCEDSGQSKTVAVERVLEKYVGEYYTHKENSLYDVK